MVNRQTEFVRNRTLLEVGERAIIESIRRHIEFLPNASIPFGDDVAGVSLENGRVAVLKVDMLVGKTDLPRGMSLKQAARKAVVMNVSDFAAKGVQPVAALVSLGLPRTLSMGDVGEIAEGLNIGAREYDAHIVGGDTGEATDLIIAVSLYGTALRSTLMLRNGGRAGDIVGVTGFFGKPSAGLHLLTEGSEASDDLRESLISAVYIPKARLREGLALSSTKAVTSSIDSSDGLAWSLHELSRASDVGFIIDKVPISAEVKSFAECNDLDALKLALYGGEEYELVVTVSPERWDEAKTVVEQVGGMLLKIGRVTEEKRVVQALDGERRQIDPRGWEHFRSKV